MAEGKEDIILFMTTMSSSLEVKKKCQKIVTVMASVSTTHNLIEKDVSRPGGLVDMRDTLKDPKALPPQLYHEKLGPLGNYDLFENAVEDNQLNDFLKKEYTFEG
ncbi:uncharacterized protein LOC134813598 [Bolinopsis microptera]|uniref:uncharacterized protein LOC134813598 n=1 Tax=Bolinopsis microptera TaxID=2820187 RepID=UPI00307A2E71